MDRSPSPVPDWSALKQMKTPSPHSWMVQGTVLIGQNSQSGLRRCKLQLAGEASALWVEQGSRKCLLGPPRWQNTAQAGSSVPTFQLKCSFPEMALCRNDG